MKASRPGQAHSHLMIRWWLCGLLVLVGASTYVNSLRGPFVFDDMPGIVERGDIRSLADWSQVLGGTNRPVLKLTLAINYAVGELDAFGYHVVNVGIHILAALVLFGIVRRTLLTELLQERFARSAPWLAFAVALLWLIHPLQTESVTYVIQRSESLMGLFYLLTSYAVIRAAQGQHKAAWGIVAVLACALGMGSKEVMVSVPLVVLLYDRTFLCGSFKQALQRRWGLYLGLAATWGVLFYLIQDGLFQEDTSAGFGIEQVSAMDYALTQPSVILHYLRLSFWPAPLCLDYGWPVAKGVMQIVPPAVVIGLLLVATVWGLWRRIWWGFAGAWFFLILAPTSSVMPIFDLAFEHRMYLSLAAVIVLVVLAAHQVMVRWHVGGRIVAGVVLVIIAATLSVATIKRNQDYHSKVAIWQAVVDVRPDNPRGHVSLGYALAARGEVQEAIVHYRQALRLEPDYADAHINLGRELESHGRLEEAIVHYRQALRLKPDYAIAHINLGNALAARGEVQEAISHYRQALQINPDDVKGHYNLGVTLAMTHQWDGALEHLRNAVRLRPDWPAPLNSLAHVLAMHPDAGVRDPQEAIQLAQRAAELTGHRNPWVLNTLAVAYAAAGQYDPAIITAQQALDLATAANIKKLAGNIRKRLEHYKQQKP